MAYFLAVVLTLSPAPKAKPLPPVVVAGEWSRLSWCGNEGRAIFRKDGSCSYLFGGQRWDGFWELKGSAISVWSRPADDGPPDREELCQDRWLYRLEIGARTKGSLSGTCSHPASMLGRSEWRLEK